MAIGARAQSAKTYLEKNFETFPDATLDELMKHALKALDVSANEEVGCGGVAVGLRWGCIRVAPLLACLPAQSAQLSKMHARFTHRGVCAF